MLWIKNGRVMDPKTQLDQVMDLLIDGEKIQMMGQNVAAPKDAKIIDATGKIVAPGLVDIHVHFREPGQTQKETIHTGALSAAAGGFTTVVMMANTRPVLSTAALVRQTVQWAKKEPLHIYTVASITENFDGETLTDFEELIQAGAVGFSDDGVPLKSSKTLRNALKKAQRFGKMLSIHEEDPELVGTLGFNGSQFIASHCKIDGAPNVSEYSMIARDMMLAYETKAKLHIQHLSAKESVDLVRFIKKMGAKVTAEVTPQHFSLTEAAVLEAGSYAKVNPPLRKSEDLSHLIEGLKDGTIDVIATDHAPHTTAEKAQALLKSPSGMVGLETSLQLGLTHLVDKKHLTLMELLEKMTWNPAQLYDFDAGYLCENGPADLVIFDSEKSSEIPDRFASKGENSPFVHQKVKGEILMTISSGAIIYEKK